MVLTSCQFQHINNPTLDPNQWKESELMQNLVCTACRGEYRNLWHICTRKFSSINLHPEFTSRDRQHWYVSVQTLKFALVDKQYYGIRQHFLGPNEVRHQELIKKNSMLPKHLQNKIFVAYGKCLFTNGKSYRTLIKIFCRKRNSSRLGGV